MSRNIYRKKKEAFENDHIALNLVKAMSLEEKLSYKYSERSFLSLPL